MNLYVYTYIYIYGGVSFYRTPPGGQTSTHAEHMYTYVLTRYKRTASKASPAKRSEPVWTAMRITHA